MSGFKTGWIWYYDIMSHYPDTLSCNTRSKLWLKFSSYLPRPAKTNIPLNPVKILHMWLISAGSSSYVLWPRYVWGSVLIYYYSNPVTTNAVNWWEIKSAITGGGEVYKTQCLLAHEPRNGWVSSPPPLPPKIVTRAFLLQGIRAESPPSPLLLPSSSYPPSSALSCLWRENQWSMTSGVHHWLGHTHTHTLSWSQPRWTWTRRYDLYLY